MKTFVFTFACLLNFLNTHAQKAPAKEEYKKEVTALTEKISKEPENVSLYFQRGTAYDAMDDFSAANKDFSKAVELFFLTPSKKHIETATKSCYYLADDYFFRISDRHNGMLFVEKGLSISPGDKNLQIVEAAIIGAYPERKKEAAVKFDFLAKKYPDDEKLLFHYGKFLEREKPDEAAKLFEKLISINPNHAEGLFSLGVYNVNKASSIYKEKGDPGEVLDKTLKGVKLLERVYALTPDDEEIIVILIQYYGYLDRKADIQKLEKKLAYIKSQSSN